MNAAARTPDKTSMPAANDAAGACTTLTYEQAYELGQKFHLSSHSVQALARAIDAMLNPPEPVGEPFVVTGTGAAPRAAAPRRAPETEDGVFLSWVADRIVHQYGEDPNVDFVLKLRRLASGATGLPVKQEPKYTVDGRSIINRATGEAIPDDEPVFIMRARDRNALFGMIEYARRCADPDHVAAVDKRISDFAQFAALYPHRIKHPDTSSPLRWTGRALRNLTRDLADRRAFVFGASKQKPGSE